MPLKFKLLKTTIMPHTFQLFYSDFDEHPFDENYKKYILQEIKKTNYPNTIINFCDNHIMIYTDTKETQLMTVLFIGYAFGQRFGGY